MHETITTAEAKLEIKRLSEEMRLLRNSRAALAGRRDPISVRNVKQLSVSIRRKYDRHKELLEILEGRGELR